MHWKRPWCWEGLGAGGEGDDRGWDGWISSLTRWAWVWINYGSWCWTGRPGVLGFIGLQRVRHNWATELSWTEYVYYRDWEVQICNHQSGEPRRPNGVNSSPSLSLTAGEDWCPSSGEKKNAGREFLLQPFIQGSTGLDETQPSALLSLLILRLTLSRNTFTDTCRNNVWLNVWPSQDPVILTHRTNHHAQVC